MKTLSDDKEILRKDVQDFFKEYAGNMAIVEKGCRDHNLPNYVRDQFDGFFQRRMLRMIFSHWYSQYLSTQQANSFSLLYQKLIQLEFEPDLALKASLGLLAQVNFDPVPVGENEC
jgi:hypothetical protein